MGFFASQCSSVALMELLIALTLTLRLGFSTHQFAILSRKCCGGPWTCGFCFNVYVAEILELRSVFSVISCFVLLTQLWAKF